MCDFVVGVVDVVFVVWRTVLIVVVADVNDMCGVSRSVGLGMVGEEMGTVM